MYDANIFFQKVIPLKKKLTSSKHSKPPLQEIFTLDVLLDTSPSPPNPFKKKNNPLRGYQPPQKKNVVL